MKAASGHVYIDDKYIKEGGGGPGEEGMSSLRIRALYKTAMH